MSGFLFISNNIRLLTGVKPSDMVPATTTGINRVTFVCALIDMSRLNTEIISTAMAR